MITSTDVLIVGGGPAGLAAAIALRQRGIDCVVVEAMSPAIDKACGEGLMPDALDALESLGVLMTEEDGSFFRGIRFVNRNYHVNAFFPEGHGIGVRRTRLHDRLAQRASRSGADLLWNSRVKLVDPHTALINGAPIAFKWLVGADGQGSAVRRWSGLDNTRKKRIRYGFRRHYEVKPWSPFVEVHWGRRGQLYITPVSQRCVCVVLVTADPKHDRDILGDFPNVAQRLNHVPLMSQQRGAITATRKLRRVADGSVALIGDASGSTDAITGEGLAVSFRQAQALAEAISEGDLEQYNLAHERIGRLPHAMSSLMLAMDRWPAIEARAMRALASTPEWFHELLSVHIGAKSLPQFILHRGPQVAWKLLVESRTCW